jgi:hypothetical protein
MPAARKPGAVGRVAELHEQAPVVPVMQSVKIARYYVSLDLLLTQVHWTCIQSAAACRAVCRGVYCAY